jgi:hypothetical protein
LGKNKASIILRASKKEHDYLTEAGSKYHSFVPKEGEQAGSRPRGSKPEQDKLQDQHNKHNSCKSA